MDCLRGALQGDYLSFVYNGGSDPGTRRTVQFERMHELKHGRAGFRAIHAGRPKLYRLALCEDMRGPMELDDAADEEAERIDDLVMQASEMRNMMRGQEEEQQPGNKRSRSDSDSDSGS